jgi:hypothetical protein
MKFEPKESLQFTVDPHGKPSGVTLGVKAYITLLVQANVIDPELWPPGFKEDATALTRVREIESDCIAEYGEFDWEKLTPAVQDEYDTLCVFLDTLQEDNGSVTWEEYKVERKEERG